MHTVSVFWCVRLFPCVLPSVFCTVTWWWDETCLLEGLGRSYLSSFGSEAALTGKNIWGPGSCCSMKWPHCISLSLSLLDLTVSLPLYIYKTCFTSLSHFISFSLSSSSFPCFSPRHLPRHHFPIPSHPPCIISLSYALPPFPRAALHFQTHAYIRASFICISLYIGLCRAILYLSVQSITLYHLLSLSLCLTTTNL